MKAQTNGDGIVVFYTAFENRTDNEGKAEVGKYTVAVHTTLKETMPVKNLLVKYIPEVLDKDNKMVSEREIRVMIDETVSIPKGGKIQISVLDNETGLYVQNIRVRLITGIKKTDVIEMKTKENATEENTAQSSQKNIKEYLQKIIQKLKSILRRLFKHEKK